MQKFRLLAAAIAVSFFVGCGKSNPNPVADAKAESATSGVSPPSTQNQGSPTGEQVLVPNKIEPVAVLSDTELWMEYGGNELAADQKYKGKYVEISGKIKSVQKDQSGKYFIGFQIVEAGPLSQSDLNQLSAKDRKWFREGFPANVICWVSAEHEPGFASAANGSSLCVLARVVGSKKADVSRGYLVELDDARPSDGVATLKRQQEALAKGREAREKFLADEKVKQDAEKAAIKKKKDDLEEKSQAKAKAEKDKTDLEATQASEKAAADKKKSEADATEIASQKKLYVQAVAARAKVDKEAEEAGKDTTDPIARANATTRARNAAWQKAVVGLNLTVAEADALLKRGKKEKWPSQ